LTAIARDMIAFSCAFDVYAFHILLIYSIKTLVKLPKTHLSCLRHFEHHRVGLRTVLTYLLTYY